MERHDGGVEMQDRPKTSIGLSRQTVARLPFWSLILVASLFVLSGIFQPFFLPSETKSSWILAVF